METNNMFADVKYIENKDLNYKDAIKLGVEQLVLAGKAKKELADAILRSMDKNGPYFVLAPKLALAHAEPGEYCLEPAMSLIVFDKKISFSNDEKHDVQILVTLSAPNATDHMDLIMWFAKFFGDKTKIDKLCSSKSRDELMQILEKE